MEASLNEITINGKTYVEKGSTGSAPAVNTAGLEYVICRTYSAGVHAGWIKDKNGKEATLLNARRLWYWDGAASLSQLAVDGVSKPGNCKFPVEVSRICLTEVIEYIPCTEKARLSIAGVEVWAK